MEGFTFLNIEYDGSGLVIDFLGTPERSLFYLYIGKDYYPVLHLFYREFNF